MSIPARVDRIDWSRRRRQLVNLRQRSRDVVVGAAVVGSATGLVVAGFDRAVVDGVLNKVLDAPVWLAAFLPALGLIVAAVVLRVVGRDGASGTADEYLHAFHNPHVELSVRSLVARLMAAVCTLGAGVPMGLEGPSLFAGASIGALTQRRLRRLFGHADTRTLMVAGAAAGVAAIFKAPATGVVFALEVPYVDDLARRMLLPALVAASSGYLVFVAINGTAPLFAVSGDPQFVFVDLAGAVALGLLCGIGARLFAKLVRRAKSLVHVSPWRRVPAAGAVLAGLFALTRVLTGQNLALSSGYNVIAWAAQPNRGLWLLLAILVIRCVATATAVSGGGVGGLFIPLAVAGTLVGRIVGAVIPSADEGLFTVLGTAAFLGAGYRVPLAAVMFVAETTGRPGFVVPGLLAAVSAELMMGSMSVTTYQRDLIAPPFGTDLGPTVG